MHVVTMHCVHNACVHIESKLVCKCLKKSQNLRLRKKSEKEVFLYTVLDLDSSSVEVMLSKKKKDVIRRHKYSSKVVLL